MAAQIISETIDIENVDNISLEMAWTTAIAEGTLARLRRPPHGSQIEALEISRTTRQGRENARHTRRSHPLALLHHRRARMG